MPLLTLPAVAAVTTAGPASATGCPPPSTTVSTPAELATALANATPGSSIHVADGTYDADGQPGGAWTATTRASETEPIWLCGGPGAILSNGGIRGGYGLHLDGADWWRVHGFTVTSAAKGIVVDASTRVEITGNTLHGLGDEGVHLRTHTTHSLVSGNEIYDTGRRRDKFGEGVYVGSASANWATLTGGGPDRSDHNTVQANDIHHVTAEPVDIKEGTTGGLVNANILDGSHLTEDGGDSCIDVKGDEWTIAGNSCTGTQADGYQTHRNKLTRIGLGDWGFRNTFTGNTANLSGPAPGYGFRIHDAQYTATVVHCDNVAAGRPFANVTCTP